MNFVHKARPLLKHLLIVHVVILSTCTIKAQPSELAQANIVWNSQSKNSSESMPCGGGDVGLNVWVEKGTLFFYVSQSGAFDENNGFLKLGRVRVDLMPNPFEGSNFRQELLLKDGYININATGNNVSASVNIWVDVHRPVVHVNIAGNKPMQATAAYESWRYRDRPSKGRENTSNSWKWMPDVNVITQKDNISYSNNAVEFYHRNNDSTIFDVTVRAEGMQSVKQQLFNPLSQLTFGGIMQGDNMKPSGEYEGSYVETDFKGWRLQSNKASRSHNIALYLRTAKASTVNEWKDSLQALVKNAAANSTTSWQQTRNWWQQYWNRSFIFIQPNTRNDSSAVWQAGRNYQLFRYMLGCNAYGQYPTKFNGGLLTYDATFIDNSFKSTPDHRNWGGGVFTAQNQRLVYWPMLKSGDVDMMKSQFDFYLRILRNAELRSETYWNHKGACFTEQMENYGLPNIVENGLNRPAGYDNGVEYNAWLEYEWDTVLEFCMMMLDVERYTGQDIKAYVPFVESCLSFFNEHYQYLARKRSSKTFDGNGHLVLYPGSGGETFKMATNATSTIAALQSVTQRLLELPPHYLSDSSVKKWKQFLTRIPPISYRSFNGHPTISPAKSWERINNVEPIQLYTVFPWSIYGVGKPGIDTAINTWTFDTLAIKFRSHVGWKQDNIWSAKLGLTDEAAKLNVLKMQNSGRRFPAFWGPGFDWVPDHNWGGAGMIGMQEMLMQVDDKKIYLFPAWPAAWEVHFKLMAPYNTTVEAEVKDGKVISLKVLPEERMKDVVNMLRK